MLDIDVVLSDSYHREPVRTDKCQTAPVNVYSNFTDSDTFWPPLVRFYPSCQNSPDRSKVLFGPESPITTVFGAF